MGQRRALPEPFGQTRQHLGLSTVTAAQADWHAHAPPGVFPLPHASWRNTGWLKRNPWFAADLLSVLRARVQEMMDV
jgi:uracil-DNA glycosylase